MSAPDRPRRDARHCTTCGTMGFSPLISPGGPGKDQGSGDDLSGVQGRVPGHRDVLAWGCATRRAGPGLRRALTPAPHSCPW